MSRPVYTLAGLRLISDFPLNGLPICRDKAAAEDEVVIRRAAVPEALPPIGTTFPNGQYNGNDILLDFPRVARFLLRDGNEILVDPAPSSDDGEVRAYLLGTAFGLLCHQRGIVPLHASAIEVGHGCVAFVGASGAGKSTLVAALALRGYRVVCDDVCFLQLGSEGLQAWPGISRIRLWEDAMVALGYGGPRVRREVHAYNKYFIPIPPTRNPMGSLQLYRIYQLQPASNGASKVTRLRGALAVEALMQNVYRLGLAERLGCKPHSFIVCAAGARDVPVFQFSRPLGFADLQQGVELLEDHLHQQPSSAISGSIQNA